ncbi:MAG TPA: DNA-processing protein DprA [Actinomycetota bacterium]|nr:DNA-processing protein DprA [Actinomycetota bacterium]
MFDTLTMAPISERAAVLALVSATRGDWYRTAVLIEDAGSALRVIRRDWTGFEPFDVSQAEALVEGVSPDDLRRYEGIIASHEEQGVRVVTVLDDDYPVNLRQVYNRPPFLFIRGELRERDNRAVAIVGTRNPSQAGLDQARRLSQGLARSDVAVLSGLARGIDSAAHRGALDAGGRTVAVMGTGIDRIYPSEHRDLADEILRSGALVSQFWPQGPPTKVSFPMRNVVMSGMAIGTVVIEASSTSGARMQARLALEHGKRLFLVKSLVMHEDWANRYAERPGTMVVDSVEEILDVLVTMARPAEQLTLS